MRGNAHQIAARWSRVAKAIPLQLDAADQETAEATVALAKELSSGTYRARRGDHPWSRHRPHPPGPTYIINVQSGKFREGWQVQKTAAGAREKISRSVINTSRQSAFMTKKGTRLMIGRPITEELGKRMRGRRLAAAGKGFLKALRTG